MVRIALVFLALLVVVNAGTLTLSNTLGSNMVLQRAPASANIWGWAAPSVGVTVTIAGQKQVTTAGADGSWLVALTPVLAGGPYILTVLSTDGDTIQLQNVMFGEVWLCGGQSNMQFTVACGFNASAEIAAANNYPNIRVFTVGDSHYSSTPLQQLAGVFQNWSVASDKSIGVGEWNAFSAVCWFTGRDLYNQYKVPIGLISSNWGGTVIQAWSSPAALKVCNVTTSGSGNQANSVLYNAMIIPFQKQVIKGVLWYQGEQNAGQPQLYSCMFPAMITDWRNTWAAATGKTFPFLFVQLAATIAGSSPDWAEQRQAQLAALALPEVGFATAVDLGDPLSPFGSVHPRDKQDVGMRLANAARNIAYGEKTIVWQGPTFQSARAAIINGDAYVNVTFALYGNGGLVYRNNSCPVNDKVPWDNCENWNIQLSNGVWYNATQKALGENSVVVSYENVGSRTVTGVSYAFASWPVTTLFSAQGLPVIPFQHLF